MLEVREQLLPGALLNGRREDCWIFDEGYNAALGEYTDMKEGNSMV